MNIRYLIITISHIVISQSQVSVGEDLWSHVKTSFPWENQLAQAQLLGVPVPSVVPTQCEQLCQRTAGCAGYNHNPTQRLCQPLAVDPEVDNVEPEISAGWLLYALNTFSLDQSTKRPCVGRPCSTHGICSDWMDVDGQWQYLCTCNHTWTGADCQQRAAVFNWEDWSDWGQCSVTCGEGYQQRTRTCQGPDEEEVESNLCIGAGVEMTSCPYLPCPVWDAWSEFDECTTWRGCGRGVKTRWRVCLNGGTVGVDPMCMGPETNTVPCFNPSRNAPVKLFDGDSQGAVMVYNDITSQWSYVCSDGWTNVDADVTCRQLGYLTGTSQASTSTVTDGLSWAMSGVACGGDEASLVHCPHAGWDPHTCTSGLAASVICIVDGQWNTWSSWGECSVTCADGQRSRGRLCDYPVPSNGGASCGGEAMEIKGCTEVPCPVDGKWLSWSAWTECNITCGGGWTSRARECTVPLHEGANCIGDWEQIQTCNDQPCPVDGYWEPWGTWEECSASCGGGTQSRTRECQQALHGGEPCEGFPDNGVETQTCGDQPCPVNGGWSSWSEWSTCPVTCGGSTHARTRQCDSPVPQYGGAPCNGSSEETRPCSGGSCPVDGMFSSWGEWGECNATCGGGWRLRARSCDDPQPQYGGNNCTEPFEESEPCNQHECAIDGEWGSWSGWAACSQSCNEGYETRNRTCIGPFHGGDDCIGLPIENRTCFLVNCPVDGGWSEWSEWDDCDVTCGGGVQVRRRACDEPVPAFGGHRCDGGNNESLPCNQLQCPVDGSWSEWEEWSECSATCGEPGTIRRQRYRTCDSPAPAHGGLNCLGITADVEVCPTLFCAVDGAWGGWGDWEPCSVTCEVGVKKRSRLCDKPAPAHNGLPCNGSDTEEDICDLLPCPVDGYWQVWSEWSDCSAHCGGGLQERNRSCVEPLHGGTECTGPDMQAKECNIAPCPIDGNWGSWEPWNVCSVSCGSGLHSRMRQCDNPPPQYGGRECPDENEQSQECHLSKCPENCVWDPWSEWSPCDVTCGGGSRLRRRLHNGPRYGGNNCTGLTTEHTTCADTTCFKPRPWLQWSPWSSCSASCGGGQRSRSRKCTTVELGPDFSKFCSGSEEDSEGCHRFSCTPALASCTEWVSRDLVDSRVMRIDPQGSGRSFPVFCNVTHHNGVGVSVIAHDNMAPVRIDGDDDKFFDPPGAFSTHLSYVTALSNVRELIGVSAYCEQFISWTCLSATIHNHYDPDVQMTMWSSLPETEPIHDQPVNYTTMQQPQYASYLHYYFGDVPRDSDMCECGVSGSCGDGSAQDTALKCNCDKDDLTERQDQGHIRHKRDLPITHFFAGDLGSSHEFGIMEIGPLMCYG